jgi:hypothetical protein
MFLDWQFGHDTGLVYGTGNSCELPARKLFWQWECSLGVQDVAFTSKFQAILSEYSNEQMKRQEYDHD